MPGGIHTDASGMNDAVETGLKPVSKVFGNRTPFHPIHYFFREIHRRVKSPCLPDLFAGTVARSSVTVRNSKGVSFPTWLFDSGFH